MTAEWILRSQTGEKSATEELIKKFYPLLRKYSVRLHYDDAYSDLLLDSSSCSTVSSWNAYTEKTKEALYLT